MNLFNFSNRTGHDGLLEMLSGAAVWCCRSVFAHLYNRISRRLLSSLSVLFVSSSRRTAHLLTMTDVLGTQHASRKVRARARLLHEYGK